MAPLPTGTITFLFTDIEGSTTRWEHQREAMHAALARHDALLRTAIDAHGGYVFKTVGDAFYAVFATAPPALEAALAAQRALEADVWSEPVGPLRVRMALHTGAAEERDGDYFGPPLNRVARLLAAGHGGQTLLSHVTQELVRDQLPAGVELWDMGEHRLKDLIRPERIFQLVGPDLPVDFPPLKTLDYHPNNLPFQPTAFVGREAHVEAIRERLLDRTVRMVTLTGTGGTGKTRLGIQVAAVVADEFADGVWLVDLAPVSDPSLVATTIATTLGVKERGDQLLGDSLRSHLRDRALLLVLDNFEQVLPAASMVADLIAAASKLKVLVTSRAPLHIRVEHEYPVPPLALFDSTDAVPLDQLIRNEAINLFVQRVQAVKPDFKLTQATAGAVAELCRRLDGLPLAIELAAARCKLLPPDALLRRLNSQLKLLTGGSRDLPVRHQTLQNTIDWSYSLLELSEQTLFTRLAIFVGGCSLEAAETVCGADEALGIDVLDGLASLVDKSLLREHENAAGEPRFTMFETIREYAQQRLSASADESQLRTHHAAYYLALAEQAEPELTGPEQGTWLQRLAEEYGNLRAVMDLAVKSASEELALRLSGALWRYWAIHGNFSEGRRWLQSALDMDRSAAAELITVRAKALKAAATLANIQGDSDTALTYYEEALRLFSTIGDMQGVATILNNLAIVARYRQDLDRAYALNEECLRIFRALGNSYAVAQVLNNQACVASEMGDFAAARRLLNESLEHWRELGDRRGLALALNTLADVMLDEDDIGPARPLLNESFAISRELGDKAAIAYLLDDFAGLAAKEGKGARALRLAGGASALRQKINVSLSSAEQTRFEGMLIQAWDALGDRAEVAWAEGRAMTLEQAVLYAFQEDHESRL